VIPRGQDVTRETIEEAGYESVLRAAQGMQEAVQLDIQPNSQTLNNLGIDLASSYKVE
jgi:hypothetical protein